jgi:hypothetical protein
MDTTSLLGTVEPDGVDVVDGNVEGAVLFLVSWNGKGDGGMETFSNAHGREDEARVNSTGAVRHAGGVEGSLFYVVISWVETGDKSISYLSVGCIRSILKAVFSDSDLVRDDSTSSYSNKRPYSKVK